MKRHPLTVEDLWALPRVGAPAPSPDGRWLVVPVATASMETNETTTRLWLVPADARGAGSGAPGDTARPLTGPEVSCSQPAWSPDGTRIAFLRKPDASKPKEKGGPAHPDRPQIHVLRLDGGEPERLTDLPFGAVDPQWLPDGRGIVFLSSVYRNARSLPDAARVKKEKEDDPVRAMVTEDRFYRYWDHWLTDGEIHHLFVLDLSSGTIVDLIPDSERWFGPDDPSGQYRIAPDGSEIAFAASRTSPPHDPILWGIFTTPIPKTIDEKTKPGPTVALTDDYPADAFLPIYAPDSRWILFGMQREFDFYADRIRLVAHNRKTGKQTVLTEAWDGSPSSWEFIDEGRTVLLAAEIEARTGLFVFDFDDAVKKPKSVRPKETFRGGTIGGVKEVGGTVYATMSTLRQPGEVIAVPAKGGKAHGVTAFTAAKMEEIELSEVEEVTFHGAEGEKVQMYLLYPPGEKPPRGRSKRAYPLVHMIHGGPHGTFPDQWHGRWNAQAFAAPGYLVALVNFHGSTGFGEEFCASILGRWGDQPYVDIMKATDLLIERGLADPDRMAVTGGSYGGYLVSWIAGQTKRFAAIVNHAGVCDFQTQYASDVTQGRARSMGGEPWDHQEGMDRYNPMRHAAGFVSPMLVIHGEKDYRVPHAQGIEIYNVYKAMGLPARLVIYPDENHWILKPRNSRHWYGEVLGWLERWLAAPRKGRRRK
ncbi:MAG: prolyl oligopeptidase family serine peptidase [Candidatus Eisenbacteria bacterium]|nr:prolyl oligopeptidase family serine peptidase [Candidatus Latescibacterota bacterium]MBD3302490.1 prolyl oligopeptidase family serine peptidase [Candidatus Eisenbacteria bacterium]